MISVIVNTCAGGDPNAYNSQGRVAHVRRAYALRNFILPALTADRSVGEVIVVGEWEPDEGYRYIPCPSVYKSCVDALAQRQLGFEAATGDVLVFQHDDHVLAPDWASGLDSRIDVQVPARYVRLGMGTPVRLNSGEAGLWGNPAAYIPGHAAVYKRAVLECCPWGAVPLQHTWDMAHTAQISAAGFAFQHTDAMRVYDVERD